MDVLLSTFQLGIESVLRAVEIEMFHNDIQILFTHLTHYTMPKKNVNCSRVRKYVNIVIKVSRSP